MPPISRKLLFVLFLIVCSNLVFAQSDKAQRRIDSLRQDIQTLEQKNDTGVVWSYIRLGLSLRNENYDTSIFYFKKGVEASERLEFHNGLQASHVRLGNAYLFTGRFDTAEYHYKFALDVIQKHLPNLKMRSRVLNNLGLLNQKRGNYEISLKYFFQALEINREAIDSVGMGGSFHNIAVVYAMQRDFEKASGYLEQAIHIFEETKDSSHYYAAIMDYSSLLRDLNRTEESLIWLDKVTAYYKHMGYDNGVARGTFQRGATLIILEKYEEAIPHFEEAKAVFAKLGDRQRVAASNLMISKALYFLKRYPEALDTALSGLEIAYQVGSKSQISEFYNRISSVYAKLGRYDSAYSFQSKFVDMQDSIMTEEKQKALMDLDAKYEAEKRERELVEARRKTEQQQASTYILYGILFFLLTIAVIIGIQYRIKQRRNTLLREKNAIIEKSLQEKEVLLKEIHHRVQNNLQFVSSLINLQSRYITDEGTLNTLKECRSRIQSMAMVHQKLYQEDSLHGINFENYVQNLIETISHSYSDQVRKVEIITEIDPVELGLNTAISMGLVLNELITNSFKYAYEGKEKGRLLVRLVQKGEDLQLTVQDDGVGLPDKFSINSTDSFGMKLVSSMAKKLKADMEVTGGIGTTVTLTIKRYIEN